MTVAFEATTEIDAPVARVFKLATSIDFHLESMASSRERAIGGVTTGRIGIDEFVSWRAWHFGIPWRLTSVITDYVENERFADRQLRGPFKRFEHSHTFTERDGRTTMYDEIKFDAPLGVIGDLVEKIVLGNYLRKLIDQRNAHLKLVAERAD